jgi:hypothetical protein
MNRLVLPILLVIALAVAVAAAWFALDRGHPHRSSGAVTTEERTLPAFSRIRIDGSADVVLVQGAGPAISVEASGRALPDVRTEVRDGTLMIQSSERRRWWSFIFGGGSRTPRIVVTFSDLEAISVTGSVNIRSDGLKLDRLAISAAGAASIKLAGLDAKVLVVDGSGAIKADITGRVAEQSISVSGAGDYRAAGLASERARIAVSGAGRVVVNATKSLDVEISGAGTVDYLGNPEVTKKVSGAGRVKRRDAAQELDRALA